MKPTRVVHTTFLCALLTAALAWTQVPGSQDKSVSISKVERKRKAPVSGEVLRVKLPRAVESVAENGLTILIMEDHRLPNISVQLSIAGAGGLFDSADMPGVASICAQMMREGTKSRTSRQIAEDVDRLGASLFAGAGFGADTGTINASGLSDNFDEWFALATDVLLNPSFPADELAKLKQRMSVQLIQQRTSPQFLLTERFNRSVYGDHPAGVVSVTRESLDKITPEVLAKWHRERYAPQNAILGVAGDVTAADVIAKARALAQNWKKTSYAAALPANPKATVAKKIYLVDRPNSVQTSIAMGNIAIDRVDPDYVPMVVMNRVIGDGPAARLFLNLREEKGYTYGVYSNFSAQKYPGPWRAGGDVRTEVTDGSMKEFFHEIGRIRTEKVPESELEEAKRAVVAGFALSLEQPTQLLGYAITRKRYNLAADYWDTYPSKISAVTAEAVERVAKKYVDPDAIQVVAVGDGSKIKPVLEKYGPVQVWSVDGKPAQ